MRILGSLHKQPLPRNYLDLPACSELHEKLGLIYDELDDTVFFSKGGYSIPKKERLAIDATGGSATYGEVLHSGISQLMAALSMDRRSVFYDIGSGTGRVVLQVACNSCAGKAVGVELSSTRHQQAVAALEVLEAGGTQHRPVEFHNADVASFPFHDGTHFFLCSTAFGAALCRRIAAKIAKLRDFRVLVTTRALPPQEHLLKLGEFECDYSWKKASTAHVYVKSLVDAPAAILARFNCDGGVCWLPSMAAAGALPLALSFSTDMLQGAYDDFSRHCIFVNDLDESRRN